VPILLAFIIQQFNGTWRICKKVENSDEKFSLSGHFIVENHLHYKLTCVNRVFKVRIVNKQLYKNKLK
jgi:hypothetical protein